MKKFRDFESAREFVRKLNLKNKPEWQAYCKSGNKPDDIPTNPNRDYKKDYKHMGDWLGTERIPEKLREYRPYKKAQKFVGDLELISQEEWQAYCKSGNKPDDIPANPREHYKNKGWNDMGDWLGTKTVANQNKIFRPFKEAQEFAQSLNLKGIKEWKEYCASGNKPDDIPYKVERTYKKEWMSWGDFLGTGTVAFQLKKYRSLKEAKEFVRTLGIKNHKEWNDYCKSGNKPDDIPADPWIVYKEWKK
jgi:hypothetical protein